MTCIVGIETAKGVWMGADSYTGSEVFADVSALPKVFEWGPALIGICGSWRGAQLLRYGMAPPPEIVGEDDIAWVFRLAQGFREALAANGGETVHDGEGATRANFLVAYRGRLYEIRDDYAVVRSARGCAANGAGYAFAYGALHATRGLPPRKRVKAALRAASALCPTVRKPWLLMFQPMPPDVTGHHLRGNRPRPPRARRS